MPTYQYACTECDHAFEQVQSFSDDALTECPQCQGRLRKLFNAVGVVFKGSGFYRTDSRAGGPSEKSETVGEVHREDDREDDREVGLLREDVLRRREVARGRLVEQLDRRGLLTASATPVEDGPAPA